MRAAFLIVGSGIAALRAALEIADEADVLVLTKADPGEGNTGYAQGGIAAAVADDDSPERHAADTIAAGDGLCDEEAVRILVEDGPRYVRELIAWGAQFDRAPDGRLQLAREGAHSVRRVLHAHDATGREIGDTLWRRVASHARVQILDHALVVGVCVEGGRCIGVRFLEADGTVVSAAAAATLLATGGAGQIFRETTNPSVATGDGIAMAYRAGARVADLEFVQFHPTALDVAGAPRFLLSEALRGEGARLVNDAGDAFMAAYDPAGDLAPRDRVARALVLEAQRTGGGVYLSMAHLSAEYVHSRFPLISDACRRAGLDLARDRIPVGPAAHYVMGGVQTDVHGRTSIPGLFAAGEVACTGVHGANRLASNSLLEGLVFGARAGRAMRAWRAGAQGDWPETIEKMGSGAIFGRDSSTIEPDPLSEHDIRDRMWRHVGLFRDGEGLSRAVDMLEGRWRSLLAEGDAPATVEGRRTASILTVARLMARAALRRTESRGAHFRADHPDRDDRRWKRHVAETIDIEGWRH